MNSVVTVRMKQRAFATFKGGRGRRGSVPHLRDGAEVHEVALRQDHQLIEHVPDSLPRLVDAGNYCTASLSQVLQMLHQHQRSMTVQP